MLKFHPIFTGPTFPSPEDILSVPTPSPEDIFGPIFPGPTYPPLDDILILDDSDGTPPYNPFPDEGATTVALEEEDGSSFSLSHTLLGLLDELGEVVDEYVDSLPDWSMPANPEDYYGPMPENIPISTGPTNPSTEDTDRHNIFTEPSFLTFDDKLTLDDSLINVGTPPYNPFPDEGNTSVASVSAGWAGIAAAAGTYVGRKLDDLLGSNENGNDNYSDDLSDEYIELIGPAPDWMLDIF